MIKILRSLPIAVLFLLAAASITSAQSSSAQDSTQESRPNRYGYPFSSPGSERNLACYMQTEAGQLVDLDTFCVTKVREPVLGTGDVQATIRWTTADDVDIAVVDPAGQRIFYQNRRVASGGQLDVDANADCDAGSRMANPVENVFWPTGRSPNGRYVVEVNLYKPCVTPPRAVAFSLRLLIKGQTFNYDGTVSPQTPTIRFPFNVQPGRGVVPDRAPAGAQRSRNPQPNRSNQPNSTPAPAARPGSRATPAAAPRPAANPAPTATPPPNSSPNSNAAPQQGSNSGATR